MAETLELSEESKMAGISRAEIDTSAPFESVKEAVTRFGGIGFWKPSNVAKISRPLQNDTEAHDIVKLEEQALYLEKDLIVKERETLDVLKELEKTKMIMEELKLKLQKETSEANLTLEANAGEKNVTLAVDESDKENHGSNEADRSAEFGNHCPSSAPGLILMELKQAKVNLSRTTTDLADIRCSVDLFNKKLELERVALEKTRERLTQKSSQISSLEEDLSQTKLKLQLAKEAVNKDGFENPLDISNELQRLSSEVEQFKKVGEAARSEVMRATEEIEQTKTRIKTAETKLIAAKRMKEAARAAEAVALAEIKALSYSDGSKLLPSQGVTLSFEEYSSLVRKARDAEEVSKKRVVDAMKEVDNANVSNTEILKKVEEATKEVKTSKKALEEALSRVEAANQEKLVVEEALRKWRSDHGQRRRRSSSSSVHGSTKFKNACSSSNHRRDQKLLDVNGMNLVADGSSPVLKPTLSIGQILSRKLLPPEETEPRLSGKNLGKPKMSLGQMLGKQRRDNLLAVKPEKESSARKQFTGKRKKFGFSRISLLLAKQSKKKKTSLNLR